MSYQRLNSPHRHGPGWPLLAVLTAGVIILVAAFFVFTDPFGGSGDDPAVTKYTEAEVGQPSRVNPLFAYASDVDRDLASLVFSGLVRLDADGTPKPDLAESWDVSDDGLTVTYHLRANVTWHTGAPFTSNDVIFTYALLSDPKLQADPEQAALWQSVKCLARDTLTVACTLPEPYAPFVTYATMGILPSTILGSGTTAASILDDPFNRHPVGTGPYSVVALDNTHALLRANKSFYLGVPHIDEITFKFYPDVASAAADIVRSQADGLLADLTINPADFRTLHDVDGLTEHPSDRSAFTILYLNDGAPPMNDPAVRGAIARAVDIDSIISSLLGGRAQRADTPIVPGTWAFSSDAGTINHDVGQARTLLDNDGWTLPSGASVRQKNNQELRISLITDQDALRGAIADAISQQLGEAGIDATVVRQPSNDLVRESLIPRQYQAAIFGWDPGADPDPYPAWHSSQTINNGRNISGYTSDDADKLLEEARRTFKLDARKLLYNDFQKLFLKDLPSIPLYVPLYTYFVSDRVSGVDPGVLFSPSSRFRNVWEWTVTTPANIGGN
ncbi:MAG: peptide ABC transporter substrate-binding protein [Chloroflexota bacterium]